MKPDVDLRIPQGSCQCEAPHAEDHESGKQTWLGMGINRLASLLESNGSIRLACFGLRTYLGLDACG